MLRVRKLRWRETLPSVRPSVYTSPALVAAGLQTRAFSPLTLQSWVGTGPERCRGNPFLNLSPRQKVKSPPAPSENTAHDIIDFMGVITKDPDILGGTPVFRGTRVPIQTLFDYLEGGETLEDFLEGFPTVSRESAVSALEEAKHLLLARS
jgi:uncharacterized protein (DUF433 family)